MVENQNVNKVVYGNQTLMDITDTTAEEGSVLKGQVFYKASGARAVGTALTGDINVIESVTMNGSSMTPDANKNVALVETDPTVPSWAKSATVADARNSLDVYSKSEVTNAISQSTANLPTIASVTCIIPNTTAQTTFDLPSGFNNAVLLGARCITKYSTLVDSSYSDGVYFGNVTLSGGGKFLYTPKVAGNSTQILFVFMKTN